MAAGIVSGAMAVVFTPCQPVPKSLFQVQISETGYKGKKSFRRIFEAIVAYAIIG
jgi:hypothetical protein